MLAVLWAEKPDMLRADLQETYGIDIERAMDEGTHSAGHMAALTANLPHTARVMRDENPDAAWTLTDVLLAIIANTLRTFFWSMGDRRKRGRKPTPIGPSWMTKGATRTLPAQVMTIDELMKELSKPRTEG